MRVVLGYDGSADADVAARLLAGVTRPQGSTVEIVHAVETRASSPPSDELSAPASRRPTRAALALAEEASERASEWLAQIPGARFTVRYGRPVTVLTDEAIALGADVIVVGSRGLGPYSTLVLGSVSAGVVDAAPCPVIVARRPSLKKVVLATDGSSPAEFALDLVAEWPMFESPSITVLSVGRATDASLTPSTYRDPEHGHEHNLDGEDADHVAIATDAARRLRAAGRKARATVRMGNATQQIIDVVKARRADMVVLGSRGHTGLQRMALGSIAREVLLATDVSVLICRPVVAD